jgi:hypothetical protein
MVLTIAGRPELNTNEGHMFNIIGRACDYWIS